MKSNFRMLKYFVVPFAIFLLGVIIYYLGILNKLLFPNPIIILKEFVLLLFDKEMLANFGITFMRVFIAVLVSVLIGIPAGLVLGYNKALYYSFEFVIDFCRSTPPIALFPLFMMFFGIGNASKIVFAVWVAALIMLVNTSYGVIHINKAHFKMAKVYSAPKSYLFPHIIFPAAMPYIFAGLRVATSISLLAIIVSEMFVGSGDGLGHAILDAQLNYRIPLMYAIILMTGLMGYVMNQALILAEKRTIHWI
jgi:ABC-type nitrate/sulfonate/bicarbonate transport system permease component